jgi:hypothetical protein
MNRKHAYVIAFIFVFVGVMFLPSNFAIVNREELRTEIHESPQANTQVSDEPVPQEPLHLNVIENPSFEDWDSGTIRPEAWYAQSSAYQHGDPKYTAEVANGVYSGLVEGRGGSVSYANSYIYINPTSASTDALVEPGISLSFNWSAFSIPDLQLGSEAYVYIITTNNVGAGRYFYYYLSTASTGYVNTTTRARFILNDTINQWNSFDRNITEDFVSAFGSGELTSTHYVSSIWFYASSPAESTDKVQAIYDDVILYNDTYSGLLQNGDFETGLGTPWHYYDSPLGYVTQSSDSTSGSYSLNLSIPELSAGSGFASCYTAYYPDNSYQSLYPRMNIIEVDWKYNDTIGAGISQYAYMRITLSNSSTYQLHLYIGHGNDVLGSTNSSSNFYIKMPGFGARDTWIHSKFDLYDMTSALGLYNLSITSIDFYVYQAIPNASVDLLVDNVKMMTYPTSDPTFEYVDTSGIFDPFIGWVKYSGTGEITQTTTSHSGSYACNITLSNVGDGIFRNLLYTKIDSALNTDFWWYLDEIPDTGSGYAYIKLEFLVSGANRYLCYVFGKTPSYTLTNLTTVKYILVDGFNETDVWHNLARNLTADIENAFSESAVDYSLFSFLVYGYADSGHRTSLLVDDLYFTDTTPPVIDSVTIESTPQYYSNTYIRTVASDERPGVSEVIINYTLNGGSSWNAIIAAFDAGGWYNAYIPAQAYGTNVTFYAIAIDGCGLQTVDDNNGFFYTYTVGDDINPTLTIDSPANNTDVEGLLTITATAEDPGSGVEYVSFNVDGSGSIKDYTYPYSQNWNLDDESLGSHYIIVTTCDNAGHTVSKTHFITVVDTILPSLDSPADVEFNVGTTGHSIDWNPTDIRPESYDIFVDSVSTYSGLWNASSEHLVLSLDSLGVGTYNYTCVVTDEGGNSVSDTVIVIVNAGATTTTTTSTGGEDILTPLLIVAGIGVVAVILIVFVALPKMKKK